MYISRTLDLASLVQKKSFFLFGPRATGKSSLIQHQLSDCALVIDLLRGDYFLGLNAQPQDLEGIIKAGLKGSKKWVVIDEIQKIPHLLDEVHRLIEKYPWHFLLTGSSARKLKRGKANLLAGRAWTASLFPLTSREIEDFQLERYLRYGGLPAVYLSSYPEEELHAYVSTYLQEEIKAEGIVRKLAPFSRFLHMSALESGNLINYAQISSDTGIPATTVRDYFSILEDTLIGFQLEPWVHSKKRKAIQTAKFYFFDCGVRHTISGTKTLDRNSNLYGQSFEQFIGMELRAYLSYKRIRDSLTFWRSTHGHEVDFLVGDHTAIEVKSTQKVTPKHLKGLFTFREEKQPIKKYYLVSQDKIEKEDRKIQCQHWKIFLKQLWSGELF